MSDRRPLDLNLGNGPGSSNLNKPLDLGQLTRDLGKIPTPVVPGRNLNLPSLDVLRATGTGSSVLRDVTAPVATPSIADTTRPATTTTDSTRTVTTPVDTRKPVADATRTTDASAKPGDAPAKKPVNGILELDYGDKAFDIDKSLAQKDYHTLKIKGLPETVRLRPWVDEGGYFFWFEKGNDSGAKHYFPPNLVTLQIDVWKGKQYKPVTKPAEELRISACQGALHEENKYGFASFDNRSDAYRYGEKMAAIADKALDLQEKALREGAAAAPKNPYFRIYLADVLVARAMKPVIDGVKAGKDVKFDNPETIKRIDEALEELKKATEITRRYGDVRKGPNTTLQPPLMPFGLNRDYYNPDAYWSGAAYQSFQRGVALTLVRTLIKSGALKIELPPALPPR